MKPRPSKQASLLLPKELKAFFRHEGLHRLSAQNILFRQWTMACGRVSLLLVISEEEMDAMVVKAHEFSPTTLIQAERGRKSIFWSNCLQWTSTRPSVEYRSSLSERITLNNESIMSIVNETFFSTKGSLNTSGCCCIAPRTPIVDRPSLNLDLDIVF